MIEQTRKLLEPLQRRIMLAIGRCVLNAVADGAPVQIVQASMLSDEVRDKLERLAEYGFTSVPLPGAQGVAVFVGGERGHGVVIATGDHRYRLTGLQGGEVALYTDEGDKVVLKRGNVVEITAATKVRIVSPLLEVTGEIKDRCDSDGLSMEDMRTTYNSHTHGGGTTPSQTM